MFADLSTDGEGGRGGGGGGCLPDVALFSNIKTLRLSGVACSVTYTLRLPDVVQTLRLPDVVQTLRPPDVACSVTLRLLDRQVLTCSVTYTLRLPDVVQTLRLLDVVHTFRLPDVVQILRLPGFTFQLAGDRNAPPPPPPPQVTERINFFLLVHEG